MHRYFRWLLLWERSMISSLIPATSFRWVLALMVVATTTTRMYVLIIPQLPHSFVLLHLSNWIYPSWIGCRPWMRSRCSRRRLRPWLPSYRRGPRLRYDSIAEEDRSRAQNAQLVPQINNKRISKVPLYIAPSSFVLSSSLGFYLRHCHRINFSIQALSFEMYQRPWHCIPNHYASLDHQNQILLQLAQ